MAHFNGSSTLNFGGSGGGTGAWVPEIFSKKAQMRFRQDSIVAGITNNDYMGEISAFGDTVNIIKAPKITISSRTRNEKITPQALSDEQMTLIIDQSNQFSFIVDDIESRFSHMNWLTLATEEAAYSMKDAYDKEVLAYMSADANVLAANKVNTAAETGGAGVGVDDLSTPDALLNRMSNMATRLSLQNVPEENRWIVMPYEALEVLAKADSKLMNLELNGGATNLTNGLYSTGKLRGFNIYVTNNAPTYTSTGSGAKSEGRFVLMAGHTSSTAVADSLNKVEKIRSEQVFGDIVRGEHVYGRKVLRPEALTISYAKFA